ncbi:MAG: phosphate acyltransferase PlsX [Firmicutes bacterium]|nr:phosphate acyltransferase PlsX [Bacillota bacterium]
MNIIIDAMGGDKAPFEIVKGAVDAAEEFDISVILVGRREEILGSLSKLGKAEGGRIALRDARDVVDMEDEAALATRQKKDSSMTVALKMLSAGEGDAVVSAGNTGALLTGATLIVKRVRGIRRAALAPVLPNSGKGMVLIDCGANAECTPEYLLQFAYMGSFYSKCILGCESPRVALLNNGVEEGKGTALQLETYALLKTAHSAGRLNFTGNVEAGRVLSGDVDVVVADGFSGNILLKSYEGATGMLLKFIKDILTKNKRNMLAAAVIKSDMMALRKDMDPNEIGGTALLGISKPVVKAHGSSDARAIRSAVRQAILFSKAGAIREIEANIEYMKIAGEREI